MVKIREKQGLMLGNVELTTSLGSHFRRANFDCFVGSDYCIGPGSNLILSLFRLLKSHCDCFASKCDLLY